MCFSATASFLAGSGIGAAGVASELRAGKESCWFAAIPLVFALQQFIEGFQWLAPHPSMVSHMLGYGFLFFAFLFWPVYIPFALLQLESTPTHQRALRWFVTFGILMSLYLLVMLILKPLSIDILPLGIAYRIDAPLPSLGIAVYVAIVGGSFFACSDRFLRWFGSVVMVSALTTVYIFYQTFISVWCFFAAVLSAMVLIYLKYRQGKRKVGLRKA